MGSVKENIEAGNFSCSDCQKTITQENDIVVVNRDIKVGFMSETERFILCISCAQLEEENNQSKLKLKL